VGQGPGWRGDGHAQSLAPEARAGANRLAD
jgi:hypothetical protein